MIAFIRRLEFFIVILGFSAGFYVKPILNRPPSVYYSSKLGTPSEKPQDGKYQTNGKILVDCEIASIKDPLIEIEHLVSSLDNVKGILCSHHHQQQQ